jgi:hypothetical protein
MASSTKSPGTFANDATVGTTVWGSLTNAGASDDAYATCTNGAAAIGRYLKSTNCGFAIPTGATIDGIEVSVERQAADGFSADTEDYAVRIVKGGTIGTTDKSVIGVWPATDATQTYGGAADLWGLTWTAADINASTFGFAISVEETQGKSDPSTAKIDHITITVTYTALVDSLPATADLPQSGSLVARWKLNEQSGTRSDSVASFDLTDNNTVLYAATPQFGTDAADFESGNTEYFSHADDDALGMSNGNSSWGFWWKWETSTTMGFFGHWSGTSQRGYGVWYTAGNLRFTYSTTGSNQIDKLFSFTPTVEKWYHIVCTYNSGTGTTNYYVNGASIGAPQVGTTGSLYNNTQTFYLGDSGAVFGKLDGAMQDAMMWDAELTAAEVEDLYNAYFNLPDEGDLPQSGSVVSRWTLTEDGGTRYDQVGTNHLTDNNTTLSGTGISEAVSSAERGADFESGNSEYLSIADNASLSITGDMCFFAWIKIESGTAGMLMSKLGNAGGRSYSFQVHSNGNIYLFISANGTDYPVTGVAWTPTLATWYHVGFVYDASAGEGKIYVDGAQQGSTITSMNTSIHDNTTAFNIGAVRSSADFFDGLMQDAILYGGVELTGEEVTELYELYTAVPSTGVPNSLMMMGIGT